jgi:hypothetical protein
MARPMAITSNKDNRCYFCGEISQYKFKMNTLVCTHHWDMMYHQVVPDHVPDEQMLDYKKLAVIKRINNDRDDRIRYGRDLRNTRET